MTGEVLYRAVSKRHTLCLLTPEPYHILVVLHVLEGQKAVKNGFESIKVGQVGETDERVVVSGMPLGFSLGCI